MTDELATHAERDEYAVALAVHIRNAWRTYDDAITTLDQAWKHIHQCTSEKLPAALDDLHQAHKDSNRLNSKRGNIKWWTDQFAQLRSGETIRRFGSGIAETWPAFPYWSDLQSLVHDKTGIDIDDLLADAEHLEARIPIEHMPNRQERALSDVLLARGIHDNHTGTVDANRPGIDVTILLDDLRRITADAQHAASVHQEKLLAAERAHHALDRDHQVRLCEAQAAVDDERRQRHAAETRVRAAHRQSLLLWLACAVLVTVIVGGAAFHLR